MGRVEAAEELEDIQSELQALLKRAARLIDKHASPLTRDRAHAYWLSAARDMLGDGRSSMVNMQNTIDEMYEGDDEDV